MNVCQEHGSKPCMTTPAHGWQRALVISGGYWLTAGRYQSWLHGGAQRIWMRQQQNGFASPSLSFSLRKAEWECQRDTRLPTTPEDTVATLQKSINKKNCKNCLKLKMWLFLYSSLDPFLPSLHSRRKKKEGHSFPPPPLTSQAKSSHIHIKTLSSSHTISGWVGLGASVKCLMWRNSYLCLYWFWKEIKRELLWGRLIIILNIYSKVDYVYNCVNFLQITLKKCVPDVKFFVSILLWY